MENVLKVLVISFAAIAVGAFVAVVTALPVMLLWNVLMPGLFGLPEISFWQALGLSMLSALLFKSSPSSGSKDK
jgi:hypothetical protein